ncbi:MAG: rhodanese-like domain-containing protein [Bacteroidales bacterium]
MKELTRTRRLTIITLIFVLILIIGFLTFSKPEFIYILTPEETLKEISNGNNEIAPELIINALAENDPAMVLVDVRNPYDYVKGFLGEAINIPVSEILTKESISFFKKMQKESLTVILYGKDQLEANGPYMFLKQLGFDNVKILLGGYDCVSNLKKGNEIGPESLDYQVENPIVDFDEVLKITSVPIQNNESENTSTMQIIPVKRKKKDATSGGC